MEHARPIPLFCCFSKSLLDQNVMISIAYMNVGISISGLRRFPSETGALCRRPVQRFIPLKGCSKFAP